MQINKYIKLVDNNLIFNNRKVGYIVGDTVKINYKDYQLKNIKSVNFQENFKLNVVLDYKNKIS